VLLDFDSHILNSAQLSPVFLRGITTSGINFGIVISQLISAGVIKAFGERTDSWAY
jgi:hypothetical protein